jgi:LysR family transcriptional regulator, nitrogen assimilation regulatory protein
MRSLRQIQSFVAVFEEGSFTAAADREGATQSGLSQHVRQLEESLGVTLLVRDGRGITPTPSGERYYAECVSLLRRLYTTEADIIGAASMGGEVRVGLMPTFTRAVLAPTLESFIQAAPSVEVQVTEAYSGVLTELVRKGDLDFAIVPGFQGVVGLSTSLVIRDREMLVASKNHLDQHLTPVCLKDITPLKLVVPGPQNTRRRTIETYCKTHALSVDRWLQLDAMMGTLDFVATSEWMAILPSVMMVNDLDGSRFTIRPLCEPDLYTDFVLIEPTRRVLSPAAKLFAGLLKDVSARTITTREQQIQQAAVDHAAA